MTLEYYVGLSALELAEHLTLRGYSIHDVRALSDYLCKKTPDRILEFNKIEPDADGYKDTFDTDYHNESWMGADAERAISEEWAVPHVP